jgi:ubiquitin-conjugating enzyme E2 variant
MRRSDAWRRSGVLAFQTLSLLLFVAFEARLAQLALRGIREPGDALAAALAVPLAFLAADLVSAVVHWWCDTFFAEDTPLLGPALIQPFREHHRDPLAITRHGFLERNYSNVFAVLPILAWAALADSSGAGSWSGSFARSFLICFGFAVAITNQIHGWAHAARVPRAIRVLQRARLVLHPRHHARHHRYGQAYCITGGWLDAALERTRVFERLERSVRRLRRV